MLEDTLLACVNYDDPPPSERHCELMALAAKELRRLRAEQSQIALSDCEIANAALAEVDPIFDFDCFPFPD